MPRLRCRSGLSFRIRALLPALLLTASLVSAQRQGVRSERAVYRIPITGVIEMGLAPYVERSLKEAGQQGAQAVLLDIDTPGGRVDAAESISDAIEDADLPVYAFVNRRALSAGALIALSADRIYMRPGSVLGAATPVTGEGQRASEKVVSAMRSEFRSLAEARGLDPRVAEAMVDEAVAIPGVVAEGKLLTLSTEEAERLRYAEEVPDWSSLLTRLDLEGAPVVEPRLNWAERVVRVLTHPLVAPFLLTLGFLGLIIELQTPAFGLAGLAGALSLVLFFGSHHLIGLAGWEVFLLLGLGVVLLLVEALILPGFGVAGALGGLAVLSGIFLSLVGSLPTSGDLLQALFMLLGAMLLTVLAVWQLLRRLPADRRTRNLLHLGRLTREEGYASSERRLELVGQRGVTLTDLRPSGIIRIGEETLDVVSSGPWVPAGTPVRVSLAEGYRLVVEPDGAEQRGE